LSTVSSVVDFSVHSRGESRYNGPAHAHECQSSHDGALSAKQDIKLRVVDLGVLTSILVQDDILPNGGNIHSDALKKRA